MEEVLDIDHGPSGPLFGGGFMHGPGFFGRHHLGCGCFSSFIITFFLLFCVFISFFDGLFTNNSKTVIESTTIREPLQGVVTKTDWYEDNIGWISNESKLIKGLKSFYNKTGVQPFVLFVEYKSDLWNYGNLNITKADEYLEEFYEENFTDEGHFIFAYFQCKNDSKQEMEGEFRYLSGYSTDAIMDDEAINIFWTYFETNYYDTSLSIEEMISDTFSETAKTIMKNSESGTSVATIILVILIIIIVIFVVYMIIKNKNRKKNEQEEKPADIIIDKDDYQKQ